MFWIEHALDTKVGDSRVRGVSGGERKRVSIAEALVTKASVQCWDNSTRGLDASTANEYVQSLRALTDMDHVSTCVALYQAAERLYRAFNKVLLIHEGRCIYFGRADAAAPYFESLGFECPPRWTTADFLTSVCDPNACCVRKGWENRVPRSADDFARAYRASGPAANALADVEAFEREIADRHGELELERAQAPHKNFTISFWHQVLALTQRQAMVMVGDISSLAAKWCVVLFLALIIGSLFYDLPQNSYVPPDLTMDS